MNQNSRWRVCANCACRALGRNPATLRLIGLCPLLAVSTTLLKAFSLALMLGAVVVATVLIGSCMRYLVSWRMKPMYHALVASFATTLIVALAQLASYEMIAALAFYPALLAVNCLVLSALQETAERDSPLRVMRRVLGDSISLSGGLVIFGAFRELGAYGRLMTDVGLLTENSLSIPITPTGPLPFLATAPGALLCFAFALAAMNYVESATALRAPRLDPRDRGGQIT